MKRICLAFVLSALVSAAFAAGTQPVTISSTTPTDLGVAPVFVQTLNQPVNICVADSSPTVGTQCNILQPGPPVTFYPADASSHVWASLLGSSSLIAYTPIYSSGSSIGSVTQGTVPWVDDVQQWADTVLGAPSNFGTSPGAVKVPGVNAYVTDFPSTYAVTGTFWQATQPISIASAQVASGAFATGSIVDLGTTADAAWNGTGNATLISVEKGIYTVAKGPLTAQSGTGVDIGGVEEIGGPWSFNETQIGGASYVLGQQLAANSAPVVLTAAQIATLTPPTTVGSTSQYPATAVPITASATGTTGATTATLTNVTGHTTYICGYSVRANATAATTVLDTVTGVITATMSSELWVAPLASGLGVDEQIFTPCIPASAVSTSIAVVSGAPGSGGLVSVKAWGYSL